MNDPKKWWDPDYFRTYPDKPGEAEGYRSVEAEVKRALALPSDFKGVGATDPDRRLKLSGLRRDRIDNLGRPSSCETEITFRRAGPVTHTLLRKFSQMFSTLLGGRRSSFEALIKRASSGS
jgi:hypothetical protein